MRERELLSKVRLTASEILATAVWECFKDASPLRGGENGFWFYYDFVVEEYFNKESLNIIEERMRFIIAKNVEIKIYEMSHGNALEYFKYHGLYYKKHFARLNQNILTRVLHIKDFIDFVDGQFLEFSGDVKAVKLFGCKDRPIIKGVNKKVIRVYGAAFYDDSDLRSFISKKYTIYDSFHIFLGEKLGIFRSKLYRSKNYIEFSYILWYAKGENMIFNLVRYWRDLLLSEGFELIKTYRLDIDKIGRDFYDISILNDEIKLVAEIGPSISDVCEVDPIYGLFDLKNGHRDLCYIFCSKKFLNDRLTFTFNLLNKVHQIFNLDFKVVGRCCKDIKDDIPCNIKFKVSEVKESEFLYKSDIDLNISNGPFVKVKRFREGYMIIFSIYFSVEFIIASILENKRKDMSQKKEVLSKIMNYDL